MAKYVAKVDTENASKGKHDADIADGSFCKPSLLL